ncbi:hypothetical protein [Dactylosporangium sp. NPDC051541]|uniref:hypothetical protein n=1 Tax=Dactylosporangium sp. NPDC051541 TaxID=3363977 RepID=UPI0037982F4B
MPDVVTPDPRGRTLAAKDIRPLPVVTGVFTHTVAAGDRLDQLAATYYDQPQEYWHICDANPDFLSPLALLGRDVVVVTRFPLVAPTGDVAWAALLDTLSGTVGVRDVAVSDEVVLAAQTEQLNGAPRTVYRQQYRRAVLVTHNRVSIDARALRNAIIATGLAVGTPVEGGQLGRRIVIPAAVEG